ncbi:hypothetical protein GCM10029964_062950 [Kibdelosporangium lantanae]
MVVDGYHDAIEWLSGFTPPLTGVERALAGRGRKFDMPLLLAQLTRALTAAGGEVVVDAQTNDLARSGPGYHPAEPFPPAGMRASTAAGDAAGPGYHLDVTTPARHRWISARSVVLATGGRQADPAVRAGLVGGGFVPPLRGNPWSRGEGAALAAGLGASVNTANKGFYGHLFAAGVEPVSQVDHIAFALYHSDQGVLLDPVGHRITDETRGDHNNAMALAAHGGRGLLLWSEAVQRTAADAPFVREARASTAGRSPVIAAGASAWWTTSGHCRYGWIPRPARDSATAGSSTPTWSRRSRSPSAASRPTPTAPRSTAPASRSRGSTRPAPICPMCTTRVTVAACASRWCPAAAPGGWPPGGPGGW